MIFLKVDLKDFLYSAIKFIFLIPFLQIMDSVIAFLNSPYLLKLYENYHRRSLKLKRNRGTSTQTNLSIH